MPATERGIYVDTSILTAYFCPEEGSAKAQSFLRMQRRLAVSWLTETELISALSRKVRVRELSADAAVEIAGAFRKQMAAGYFEVIAVLADDYRFASRTMASFNNALRTLDSLHLAVASRAGRVLATADRSLALAAKRLNVSAEFVDYNVG